MAPELALGGLQRWMQSVIVHPGSIEDALASPEAAVLVPPAGVGEVLLPSATLAAGERIGIYHEMYLLRMTEALDSDYPALAHFLGPERFTALVRGYLAAHPSRSYTLNVLGRSLADWLAAAPDLARRGFCRDLARLEWAVTEAFDAPELPRLAAQALEAVPPEAWDVARLVPSAALRLLELRWNANEWLDSAKDDRHHHPKPRRRDGWIAVFRQGYSVYRRELSRAAFRLLQDLVSGRSVGEALKAALDRRGTPGPEALTRWFRDWASDGLFSGLEIGKRELDAGRSSDPARRA
jgi:hypothetical protein